jgi:hypothetical protein
MGVAAAAPPPLAPGELPVELLARCLVACDSATALALAECVSRTWRTAALAAWPRVLAAHGGGEKDAYVTRRCIRRWLPSGDIMLQPAVLRGHTSAVLCCAQRFDAATGCTEFASGGADSHARVWRPPLSASCSWSCDGPLRHAAPVTAVAFTLTGGALVTASGSSSFVWRGGVCFRRFGAAGPNVSAIALTHEELFCASVDGRLRVFDLLSGALLRELRPPGGAPAACLAVAMPPAPPLLASAGADGLRVGHATSAAELPWAFDDCGAACAVALRQGDAAVAFVGRADGAVVRVCLRTGASLAPARLHHRATVTLHAPPGAFATGIYSIPHGCSPAAFPQICRPGACWWRAARTAWRSSRRRRRAWWAIAALGRASALAPCATCRAATRATPGRRPSRPRDTTHAMQRRRSRAAAALLFLKGWGSFEAPREASHGS